MGDFLIVLQFYLMVNPNWSTAVSDADFYTDYKMVCALNTYFFHKKMVAIFYIVI